VFVEEVACVLFLENIQTSSHGFAGSNVMNGLVRSADLFVLGSTKAIFWNCQLLAEEITRIDEEITVRLIG
jgi:hypothetical protein